VESKGEAKGQGLKKIINFFVDKFLEDKYFETKKFKILCKNPKGRG